MVLCEFVSAATGGLSVIPPLDVNLLFSAISAPGTPYTSALEVLNPFCYDACEPVCSLQNVLVVTLGTRSDGLYRDKV